MNANTTLLFILAIINIIFIVSNIYDVVSVRLVDTKKNFSRQAIKHMKVVKEAGLLISLAGKLEQRNRSIV